MSIRNREKYKVTTGDPWDGRTLEWSIPSPAPFYNFAITPNVDSRDPFWETKQKRLKDQTKAEKPIYKDIHMPKNTATGFIIAMFSAAFGFAMVWHIMWLVAFGLIGVFATVIARTFNSDTDYYVKAADVEKLETDYLNQANLDTKSAGDGLLETANRAT